MRIKLVELNATTILLTHGKIYDVKSIGTKDSNLLKDIKLVVITCDMGFNIGVDIHEFGNYKFEVIE